MPKAKNFNAFTYGVGLELNASSFKSVKDTLKSDLDSLSKMVKAYNKMLEINPNIDLSEVIKEFKDMQTVISQIKGSSNPFSEFVDKGLLNRISTLETSMEQMTSMSEKFSEQLSALMESVSSDIKGVGEFKFPKTFGQLFDDAEVAKKEKEIDTLKNKIIQLKQELDNLGALDSGIFDVFSADTTGENKKTFDEINQMLNDFDQLYKKIQSFDFSKGNILDIKPLVRQAAELGTKIQNAFSDYNFYDAFDEKFGENIILSFQNNFKQVHTCVQQEYQALENLIQQEEEKLASMRTEKSSSQGKTSVAQTIANIGKSNTEASGLTYTVNVIPKANASEWASVINRTIASVQDKLDPIYLKPTFSKNSKSMEKDVSGNLAQLSNTVKVNFSIVDNLDQSWDDVIDNIKSKIDNANRQLSQKAKIKVAFAKDENFQEDFKNSVYKVVNSIKDIKASIYITNGKKFLKDIEGIRTSAESKLKDIGANLAPIGLNFEVKNRDEILSNMDSLRAEIEGKVQNIGATIADLPKMMLQAMMYGAAGSAMGSAAAQNVVPNTSGNISASSQSANQQAASVGKMSERAKEAAKNIEKLQAQIDLLNNKGFKADKFVELGDFDNKIQPIKKSQKALKEMLDEYKLLEHRLSGSDTDIAARYTTEFGAKAFDEYKKDYQRKIELEQQLGNVVQNQIKYLEKKKQLNQEIINQSQTNNNGKNSVEEQTASLDSMSKRAKQAAENLTKINEQLASLKANGIDSSYFSKLGNFDENFKHIKGSNQEVRALLKEYSELQSKLSGTTSEAYSRYLAKYGKSNANIAINEDIARQKELESQLSQILQNQIGYLEHKAELSQEILNKAQKTVDVEENAQNGQSVGNEKEPRASAQGHPTTQGATSFIAKIDNASLSDLAKDSTLRDISGKLDAIVGQLKTGIKINGKYEASSSSDSDTTGKKESSTAQEKQKAEAASASSKKESAQAAKQQLEVEQEITKEVVTRTALEQKENNNKQERNNDDYSSYDDDFYEQFQKWAQERAELEGYTVAKVKGILNKNNDLVGASIGFTKNGSQEGVVETFKLIEDKESGLKEFVRTSTEVTSNVQQYQKALDAAYVKQTALATSYTNQISSLKSALDPNAKNTLFGTEYEDEVNQKVEEISGLVQALHQIDENGNIKIFDAQALSDQKAAIELLLSDLKAYIKESQNAIGANNFNQKTDETAYSAKLKELEKTVKKIKLLQAQAEGKINTGENTQAEAQKKLAAEKENYEIIKNELAAFTQVYDAEKVAKAEAEARAEAEQKVADIIAKQKDAVLAAKENRINSTVNKAQSNYDLMLHQSDSAPMSDSSLSKLKEYKTLLDELKRQQESFSNNSSLFDDEKAINNFNKLSLKLKDVKKEYDALLSASIKFMSKIENASDLKTLDSSFNAKDVSQLKDAMQEFANSASNGEATLISFNAAEKTATYQIKGAKGQLQELHIEYDKGTNSLGRYIGKVEEVQSGLQKFVGGVKGKFKGALQYVMGFVGFYRILDTIKKGITYVKEIDAALTELKKVTDETDKTYANFLKTASQTGSEIGSTIADFTNATADFARLGYTISEATELAKAASIYKNVGDGIESVSQATESIISTMKAFGIEAEDSMSIVDKFNEVGNRFAISSTGIGEALQRSASALYESGNTIDESIALITAANSVIQNPEQVGTALKTLSLRLRGAKVELQEAGEDTDNMAESVSSLQAKLLALTHGKVDIMADATTFKNTTEILREMSSAWSDMTDIERAAALELMGGKRQANILASIIKNYDTVDDVIETSLDSQNSAYEENAKWMDSIEGKMTEFKNAVQSLWQDVLGSNAIKDVISLGTGLVNIVDTIGAIPTILGGIAVYFFAIKKNNPITMFKDLANTIQNFNTAASNVQTLSKVGTVFDSNSVNLYAAAVSNLSAKQQALALSSAGLTKQQVAEVLAKNGCSEATIEQAVAEANLATAKTTTNTITGEQLFNLAAEKDIKLSEQAVTWLTANAEAELTREKILAAVASGELAEADGKALIAMSGLSAGAKGLGASLKALFLSNPVGLALMAVTAIAAIVSAVKRAKEEAKHAAQETLNAYKDAQNTLKSNKNTINEISSDYERLSKGVDDFGNNISLTTDEYKKYNEITNKIADMFPEMISGYTKEGTAILSCKGNVDELTKAYEAAAQAARQAAIAGGSGVFDSAKEEYNSNPSVSWEETGLKQKQKLANKLVELANQGTEEEIQKFFNDLNAGNIEIDGEKYSNIELDALFKEAGIDISDFRSWWDNSIDVDKYKEKMRSLESFIKTSVTKINTETSKVRSILSAYLGEDEDYAKLDDETKSIINNIVSQLDSEFVFSFDNIDSLYNWVSENIVQAFSGNNGKVQNAIKDFLKIDTSSLSVTDYKKEIENFKKVLSDSGISEEAQKQILSAFKIDDDSIKAEIDPLVNHTKSILKDEFDDKVDSLTISDLKIVDSLDIPDGTLLTWDELLERINAVKSEMRTPVVQTYDTIKGSIENFNDVQKQTEDIMLDNTEVTQEYKDSLVALGISETDLASCFDKNNKLVVKNVSRLKQLVNASKTNISTQTILARAQARLKYKELYKQLATLTNGQLDSAQANREKINTLYQEMSAIQKVISRYSLLEQQLSEVTKIYSEFEEAQSFDSANDYMSKTEDMLTAAIKAYETGDLGTETAQVAIKALTPDVEFEGLDTVDEKAEKAHEYLTETLNKYFTIELDDNGAIQSAEMKLGNLRKFIEDAFSNNVFSGEDWQHFEWSDEFLSGLEDAPDKLQYFADKMNVTKEVALSAIQEIKNKDAEWLNGDYGSLFDQIVPETLDAKLQDTTAKLAELNVQLANGKVSQEEYETAIKQLNTQLVEQQKAASDACQSFIDVNGKIDESQKKLEAYQKQLSTGTDTNGNQLTSEQIEEINGGYNQELQNYEGYLQQKQELENKYGPMTEYTVSVALEQNGINVDEINTELTNVKQNIQEAFNSDNFTGANKALEDTYGIIAKINENGDIEYSVTDNTSDDQKKTLEELGALNADGTVDIDCLYSGLTDEQKAEVDKLETLQEKKNLIDYYLSMDGVDTAQSSIDELATTLTNIYELLQTSPMFKASVDEDTKTTLDGLLDKVKFWNGPHWATFKAKVSSIFSGNSGDQESNGTANVSGTAHATGSWGLEQSEHNALVGELGMETVVDPNTGRYYTVGDHGAELVDLPKNAIIFNHKQTDALFRNGYINSRGKAFANGNAHIDGNAHVTIYPNYTLHSQWEGTGYKSYDDGMYSASNALQDAAGDISAASDSVEDAADDAKQTIDFIEYRLDEIENIITNTTNRLENFLDDTSQTEDKNSLYEDLVSAEKQKASTYFSAAATYNKKAAQLLSEVPAEYQEMAKNGAIAIKDFVGENEGEIADAIEEYRTWSSKAEDAENNYLESIAEISAKRLEQLQDIADDFENIVGLTEQHANLIQAEMDLLDEAGERLSDNFYNELMKDSKKQIEDLNNKRASLQDILDNAVKSGDVQVGSDDWYEMVNAIFDVDDAILECKKDIEGFQNSINDLYWDNLDKLINRIDNVDSELSHLYNLVSDEEKVVDDAGNWTKDGVTALGLLAQQLEVANFKVEQYGEAIAHLEKDYAAGLYSTDEYNEKLAELKENQWGAIEAQESAKKSLIDLNKTRIQAVKDGMQKEIDAYSKLIDRKKEELNLQKESHDFSKQVAEQQKNIADIEKRLAVISGDNSASAIAQKKKLQAELAQAKEELEELYYDHSVEKQQDALDKQLEDYQNNKQNEMDALDESLKNEDQIIQDSYTTIAANTELLAQNLSDIADKYGITLSDSVTKPWLDGADAIGTYQGQLDTSMSAFTEQLKLLKQELIDLQVEADKTANSIINATNSKKDKTESARYTPPAPAQQPSPSPEPAPAIPEPPSKGSSVTVKSSATHFSRNGGNGTRMQSWVPGSTFTVYQVSGDEVLLGRNGGYTGWVKLSDIEGYAKGSKAINKDQFAFLDEFGEELQLIPDGSGRLSYVKKGTGIIPADLTERLMEWGQLDPSNVLEQSKPTVNAPHVINNNIELNLQVGEVVHIDHADNSSIPNIAKAVQAQMDNYMKNVNKKLYNRVR